MIKILFGASAICAIALAGCISQPRTQDARPAHAAALPPPQAELIPRTVVFGNPQRSSGSISPDGRWLGYLAPDAGVLNVWIAPADAPAQARAVTRDRLRGIRNFTFAFDNRHILFLQDEGGNENFHVYAVDLETGAQKDLTPFPNARASIAGLSRHLPGEVLVSANDRNPQFFDLHRIDIASGKRTRIERNDGFGQYVTDAHFRPLLATRPMPDGSAQWLRREGDRWTVWTTVPQEDGLTTHPLGFTDDGRTFYLVDSRDRDTSALYAVDWTTGEHTLLHRHPHADVGAVLTDPKTGAIRAVSANYLREKWKVLDTAIARDLAALLRIGDGEISVTSMTLDDRRWVVLFVASDASPRYYLYDRDSGDLKPWFETRPELARYALAPMHAVTIPARDGLELVSYYTLPVDSDPDRDGKPAAPLPMVLLVHGGPWGRDTWGLDGEHQWLANRGYAVLSVNFRASSGFGKAFLNAGDLQWGRKMHDDLLDAVDWAVAQGIAERDKVAIMGGSYGGYATLAGLTMTPEVFACGVDIVGPSNLFTLLGSIPAYWASFRAQLVTRMGDPDTEEGRALLKERSPLTYADRIVRPLLIGQGRNDPRVNVAESEQIVDAMRARDIPVTYVLYPDEGHGFARPPNRLSFNAVAELFLGRCLHGRVEPIGDAFAGSTITVPTGADLLPGLPEALARKAD